MTKLYIVSSGSYSDYHISRIFSSKEKAETWIGEFTDTYRIEDDYILDDESQPNVPSSSNLYIDLLKNSVIQHSPSSYKASVDEINQMQLYESYNGLELHMTFEGFDKERNLKVCSEKRAQLLALNRIEKGVYHRHTLEKLR